ncbi:MAG TPA: response regulator transcription factor [Thermoanaerobaculia bacterium]|nr:response regulator transcription factor [Thermoanaerobaculia bacterium]
MKILLAEDDPDLGVAVSEVLRDESYAVDHAPDGSTAAEFASYNDYDLAILDYQMPPPTGVELVRLWRGEGKTLPILMLTARSAIEDRVTGLDAGADDYLTKPFDFSELLARVRSLLRRREKSVQAALTAGDLQMDRAARLVTVAGSPIELSPKEFALLEYLLSHVDQVISRSEIEEHVWDSSFDSLTNIVDVLIHRLRKKIDGDRPDRLIHTVKGAGYRLSQERC